MEKGRFVILLSAVVVLVGSLVFLKWAIEGKRLDRSKLIENKLKVLSYSTFVSSSGPAPELVEVFEKTCQCEVEFVTAGDAGLLLERLKTTQDDVGFDLVIGLDQFWAQKALKEWKWHQPKFVGAMDRLWVEGLRSPELQQFVPFDYAPMTFIYRKSEVPNPPQSLRDFLEPEYRSSLSLQDPRSSSPGLQFLSWVERTQEDPTMFLKNLKASIHSVSPSWALSYGLFKKKQSQFVFSYVSSLAYHLSVENDSSYAALQFEEGHPVQVEHLGIPEGCQNCQLAEDFVQFLLEPKSQEIIAQKNFMFPVMKGVLIPSSYSELPQLKRLPISVDMPDLKIWDMAFE